MRIANFRRSFEMLLSIEKLEKALFCCIWSRSIGSQIFTPQVLSKDIWRPSKFEFSKKNLNFQRNLKSIDFGKKKSGFFQEPLLVHLS